MIRRKSFFILLLVVVCTMASGCFRVSNDTTFNKDGSVDMKNTILAVPLFAENIQEMIQEAKKNPIGSEVKEVHDGNMSGVEETVHYSTIADMARANGNMFKTVEGKAKGVQQSKGWLYDTYAIDLIFEGEDVMQSGMKQEDLALMQTMLSSVVMDITFHFPYAVENHNADQVTDNGKTLKWDLAPSLMNGRDKSIQATFRIWNMTNVYITAAGVIVLGIFFLGGVIGGFFCRKASIAQFAVFGFGIVSFLGLIVVAGFSLYSYMKTPVLTSKEVISPVAASSMRTRLQDAIGISDSSSLSKTGNNDLPQENTESAAEKKQGNPAQEAVRVFQGFHRDITNRNLRAAYDTLGYDMQSEMTYEGWAPGFDTTLSSTPYDIEVQSATDMRVEITYVLRAVDNPGGTRYFDGRAVIIKRGSEWKIDEIINKPR